MLKLTRPVRVFKSACRLWWGSTNLRMAAVDALVPSQGRFARRLLVSALSDNSAAVRERAAKTLLEAGWRPVRGADTNAARNLIDRCRVARSDVEFLLDVACEGSDPQLRTAAAPKVAAIARALIEQCRDSSDHVTLLIGLAAGTPLPALRATALRILAEAGQDSLSMHMLGPQSSTDVQRVAIASLREMAKGGGATRERIREAGAVDALWTAVGDPNPMIAQMAKEAFTYVADPAASARLRTLLQDQAPHVRRLAEAALTAFSDMEKLSFIDHSGVDAIPRLAELMRDSSSIVSQKATDRLVRVGSEEARAALHSAASDPVPRVAVAAGKAYASVAPLEHAVELLKDASPEIRLAATDRLNVLGNADAACALEPLLLDPDPQCSRSAARVLSRLGHAPQTAETRVRLALLQDSSDQADLLSLSEDATGEAIESVVAMLSWGDASSRQAERYLGFVCHRFPELVALVYGFLSSRELPVSRSALHTLLEEGTDGTALKVAESLATGLPGSAPLAYSVLEGLAGQAQVVSEAALVLFRSRHAERKLLIPLLGACPVEGAVDAMIEASLEDPDAGIRSSARQVLEAWASNRSSELVASLLRRWPESLPLARGLSVALREDGSELIEPAALMLVNGEDTQRADAAGILGRIGGTGVLPLLARALRDPCMEVRVSARASVGALLGSSSDSRGRISTAVLVEIYTALKWGDEDSLKARTALALSHIRDPSVFRLLLKDLRETVAGGLPVVGYDRPQVGISVVTLIDALSRQVPHAVAALSAEELAWLSTLELSRDVRWTETRYMAGVRMDPQPTETVECSGTLVVPCGPLNVAARSELSRRR